MTQLNRFIARPSSPLTNVAPTAWWRFVAALDVQPLSAVSARGGFGAYDIQPRRLVELEVATNLRREPRGGRNVQQCDFVAPWTRERFLSDPLGQYVLFAKSISQYNVDLERGELKLPTGATKAETLAALHVGGRGALEHWDDRFEETRRRCDAVRELF